MSFQDFSRKRFPYDSPRRCSRSRSPIRRLSSEELRRRNIYVRRSEESPLHRLRYQGGPQKPTFKGAEKSISYDEKDLKSIQVNIRGIKCASGPTVAPLITKSDLILVRNPGESLRPLFSKDKLRGRSSSEECRKSQEPTRVISLSDNSVYPDKRSSRHERYRSPSPFRRRYNYPSPQRRSVRNRTPDRKLREPKDCRDRKYKDDHLFTRRRRISRSHSSQRRRTNRRYSRERSRRERSEERRRRERSERFHRLIRSPVRAPLRRSRTPPPRRSRTPPPPRHSHTPLLRRSRTPPRRSRTRSRSLVSISPEYEGDILQKSNGSAEEQPTADKSDRRKKRNAAARNRRAIRKLINSEVPISQIITSSAGYVPPSHLPPVATLRPMQPWNPYRPLTPVPMLHPQMSRMPVVPPPPMIPGMEHLQRYPIRYFPPMHKRS